MACARCDYTGWTQEYEEGSGWVDVPCPICHGVNGDQPDWVDEMMDVCLEAETEAAWAHRHVELVYAELVAVGLE